MNLNAVVTIITSSLLSNDSTIKRLSDVVRLRAVTDFAGLKEYYYHLYTTKTKNAPTEPSDPLEGAKIRKTICRKIFTTTYFEMRDQEWIDVDENVKISYELFNQHEDVFELVFKWHEGADSSREFEYDNPYRVHSFHYDSRPETDYMFFCFTRKHGSGKIKVYLVTQPYDVNLIHGSPMAGRFIFKYKSDNLALQALAEESAIQSLLKKKGRFAEYLYIKRRQNEGQDLWPASADPVCSLSRGNKLRLCATLYASKMLRKKYVFWPTIEHVEVDCVSRRISFVRRKRVRTLVTLRWMYFDENKIYEERMIGCKAMRIDSNEVVTYYVSRGDVKNTIFAYKRKFSDDRIFVAGYLWNVSVVGGTDGSPTNWQFDDDDLNVDTAEEGEEGEEEEESVHKYPETSIGAELCRHRGT